MKRRVYRNAARSRAALTFTLLVASVLPIAAPHAQQTEDADTLADLKACVAIERSNARLACYDGVLGRAPSPPGSAASTVVSPATTPVPAAAVTEPGAEPAEQTVVVVELRLHTPSSAVFVTATGEVYEQIDTGRGRYPEVPFEAKIESGSLGSRFLVSPAGGPRIRVKVRR